MIWRETRLGDVCNFVGGSQPPKSEFEYIKSPKNVRLIQIRDYKSDKNIVYIPKQKAKRFCTKSDVMIGRYGPPIFQILRGIEGAYNVALMKAVPKQGLDNNYLFYFLQNNRLLNYVIAQSNRAAGQSGVKKEALEKYPFLLPPIEEQKKIVEKINLAFNDIDLMISNTSKSQKYLSMILSEHLLKTFSNKNYFFQGTISEFCLIKSGITLNKKLEKSSGDLPYLKVADMNLVGNEKEITNSTRFLDYKNLTKSNIIEEGSIIFPKRGGAIATNKKRITNKKIAIDLNIMAVKPKKVLNPNLLFYYFLSIDLGKLGSGSSIPQINNYDIEPLKINFPKDLLEQDLLVDKLDNLTNTINNLKEIYKKKIQNLIFLKSNILTQELQH